MTKQILSHDLSVDFKNMNNSNLIKIIKTPQKVNIFIYKFLLTMNSVNEIELLLKSN